MDAERDEDLLVVAPASVGFLVMATCHEIKTESVITEENVGEVMDW